MFVIFLERKFCLVRGLSTVLVRGWSTDFLVACSPLQLMNSCLTNCNTSSMEHWVLLVMGSWGRVEPRRDPGAEPTDPMLTSSRGLEVSLDSLYRMT